MTTADLMEPTEEEHPAALSEFSSEFNQVNSALDEHNEQLDHLEKRVDHLLGLIDALLMDQAGNDDGDQLDNDQVDGEVKVAAK
jgi:hypothetical protein